ncbi:HAD-IIA family hydrolase [Nostocoides jenkinsii]|uniref:Putative hydrolase (Modular protein) n=1 Tax=Nostocoides jenkinsii Ben 74 TaxID=1193518 RepID=A0A077MAR0_9MICO|nr:HAD-IIA family hydrolase [Tetrasphaera jenkinsii]CCI51803.1 Putative hydrolase (modular protein) [Tetrasphaera jenkinsii Ben 74]
MGAPLLERYRGLVCDLDGVVYRGPEAVPYAVQSLNACSRPVVYATNNASRPPAEVAAHLRQLGLSAGPEAVVNSSMAGAAQIAARYPAGSPVLAVGGAGVAEALRDNGFRVVTDAADGVVAVLQGYGPDVRARDLAEAAYAIERGAAWIATNDDLTLPTERGIAPGNGTLVAAVATATGRQPVVVGKPHAPLYLMSVRVLGVAPADALGIGDRLETDVEGATAAGMDCLLVLSGVHNLADAALAAPARRPRYVLRDLRGLAEEYPDPVDLPDGAVACGASVARISGDALAVTGRSGEDGLDAARAALQAVWRFADAGGERLDEFAAQVRRLGELG